MKPYLDTHSAGNLLLVVLLAWLSMEAIQLVRQWRWRAGATSIGRRSFWLGFAACLIVTNVALYLGPSAFPAATIRPGAAAFAAGMVILVAGAVLRGWSFYSLGRYFTAVIKVSPDQPVIASGPYRLLRHPSYAGGLLAEVGIAVTSANWASVAAFALAWAAIIAWRIQIEETALLSALGDTYSSYASHHKRLVPLIW
ncbi:MAG: methyltransferase family protein [Streptosporangiaceae bacterium]